jgi:predicted ATPase
VLLLCGEPGIGKSRIVRALRERLGSDGAQAWQYQCSPYFSNSALYPIVAHMERALRFERDEPSQARLNKLEAFVMGQLGRPALDVNLLGRLFALPVEERYGALPMSPQKQKDETLRALGDLMQAASREKPLLVLFEDHRLVEKLEDDYLC